MKNVEFKMEADNQFDDWSEESDTDQGDEIAEFDTDDSALDEDLENESEENLAFSSRRMQGLKNGLTARRKIEQLREQRALHRQLEEYDDSDFLN